MNVYKKMYYSLFNKVTNAIEELKSAQQELEEIYISSGDESDEEHDGETDEENHS